MVALNTPRTGPLCCRPALHSVGSRADDPAAAPRPRPEAVRTGQHTVFFTNLGMLGMNVGWMSGCSIKSGWQIHSPTHQRLTHGRIGP